MKTTEIRSLVYLQFQFVRTLEADGVFLVGNGRGVFISKRVVYVSRTRCFAFDGRLDDPCISYLVAVVNQWVTAANRSALGFAAIRGYHGRTQ